MVIDDLDVEGVAVLPAKADAPLIVDANTVLARAIPFELLEPVAGWDTKVNELLGGVHEAELAEHEALELGREPAHGLAAKQALGVPIGEAVEHPG